MGKEGTTDKKGEVTAFLSLIFVLLVSFILAMTKSAQVQTEKNVRRLEADRAVYSLFGEYQKELLEEYDIFALEGTYETGTFDEQQILDRLIYYGCSNVQQEITGIQYLTDNDGQAFREQILEYMETKSGLGMVEDMMGASAEWESQKIQGEQASGQLEEVLEQGEALVPEHAEEIESLTKTGLLAIVLPEEFELSGKSIQKEQQVSERTKNIGKGHFPAREDVYGIKGKVLFQQYLEEKLNSAVGKKTDGRSLDYELEYLISGKNTDEENLRDVVRQLLLVRMGLNYAYLMTDAQKKGEADVMALTLATIAMVPEAKDAVKQLLLLLWAVGESTVDVRSLLGGKRIPAVKSSSNWVLPLSSVFTFWASKMEYEAGEQEKALDYGAYLQILLYMKNQKELTMRALDRVEENLRFEKKKSFFFADYCITKIRLQNQTELWNGCTYSFPTYFGYL